MTVLYNTSWRIALHFTFFLPPPQTWKAGKRRAEKDEYVGGTLLMNIEHPGIHVELDDA
jgi:hypothetical protein